MVLTLVTLIFLVSSNHVAKMPRKFQFTVDKWAKKPVTKEEEGATPLKVSYNKCELRGGVRSSCSVVAYTTFELQGGVSG